MRLILFTLLLSASAFAGLDGLAIKELNLEYQKPYGKGDVEKIGIGLSTKALDVPYPVEIFRTEKNFDVKSNFVDLTWNNAWGMIHDLEKASIKKGNIQIGSKEHNISAHSFWAQPQGQGLFKLEQILARCLGHSEDPMIEFRLMDDCREGLALKVKHLNVPIDFFLANIVSLLEPQAPLEPEARPLDNLVLTSNHGDFALMVYTRVVFYAGLRAWGHVAYEDGRKVVTIRIDQVKFGILPITALVMKELRKLLKGPDITITGNTIRIKIQ